MPASSQASDFDSDSPSPRFSDASVTNSEDSPRLRGLRWRVLLGVLPTCPAPIEALRRAAANGRRRYAEFRRRLIVDPHVMEEGLRGDNPSVDNPLSQDPESVWGRYFRNAEIEKTIESDLTRLYPEHGGFFQSSTCQAMMRRILLVWALIHPQYGYRQGMHEVLAPLLYVLHMDVTHLSQVRQRYEDPFEDRFDTPFEENLWHGKQMMASFSAHSALLASKEATLQGDEDWVDRVHPEDLALVEPDDFGFNLKTMVLGSDSYGAEGELGALLSTRFVEHDAYCLLDALLRGQGGAVVLADYFMAANETGSATGLSPVIEASAAMYHILAAVDMPLYIHLVGLGVEPQFFALRWLRVLFGREFELDKLLLLWDAIFSAPNSAESLKDGSNKSADEGKRSPRGSFISSFAVSMLLQLRPTLLAAPDATSCLQKLLNFPKHVDIRNLIENAKVLQSLSEEPMAGLPSAGRKYALVFDSSRGRRKHKSGSHSPPFQPHIPPASKVLQHRHTISSPDMMRPVTESYWEERWINSVLPKVVPEEVSSLQSSEAGLKDNASCLAVSNGHGDKASNHNAVHDDSEGIKQSTSMQSLKALEAHCVNKTSRPTKRSLLPGLLEDALTEDRKETVYVSSSEDSSPRSLYTSQVPTDKCNDASAIQQDGLSQDPSRGVQEDTVASRGLNECVEASSETAAAETLSQRKEDNANYEREYIDEQPIPLSTGSFSDNELSDDPAMDMEPPERHIKANRTLKLSDTRNALQTLGHSMVESIQILENAFSLKSSPGKEGASAVSREPLPKNFLAGKGHVSALSALAELRKISNILLQM